MEGKRSAAIHSSSLFSPSLSVFGDSWIIDVSYGFLHWLLSWKSFFFLFLERWFAYLNADTQRPCWGYWSLTGVHLTVNDTHTRVSPLTTVISCQPSGVPRECVLPAGLLCLSFHFFCGGSYDASLSLSNVMRGASGEGENEKKRDKGLTLDASDCCFFLLFLADTRWKILVNAEWVNRGESVCSKRPVNRWNFEK